jgi:hypothetical protein
LQFDSQPVLGNCYLSATAAGKATNTPTYNVTIPRMIGRVVQVLSSATALVELDVDRDGDGSYRIVDYEIPGTGVTKFDIPNISAKFQHDIYLQCAGAATMTYVQLTCNDDGAGCVWGKAGTGGAWTGGATQFPRVGATVASGLAVSKAVVRPRIGGMSLVESHGMHNAWDVSEHLVGLASITVDFTLLSLRFQTTGATSGNIKVVVSDPFGVG